MKREMRHGRRGIRVLAIVLVSVFFLAESASAVPLSAIKLLGKCAVWVGKELVSYGFGKAIDKMIGSSYENQLGDLRRDLEAQIARSSAGAERTRLQSQLALTQSQLGYVQTLLYSELTSEKVAELQRRVQSDLSLIRREVAAHERRLGKLEGDVAGIEDRLKSVEDRLGLRPLGRIVSIRVGRFSVADGSVPRGVIASASDRLVARLSHDDRLRVTTESEDSQVDAEVDGVLLRYSVEERPFSGYNVRTLTLIHRLELSLRFSDPTGTDHYFSRVYQREKSEFFPDGVDHSASSYGVAHELIDQALAEGTQELIQFIFLEEGEELAEADLPGAEPSRVVEPEPDPDEVRFDEAAATAHTEMSTGLQIRFQIDPGDAFIRTWRRGEPRAIVNGRASEYDSRKKGTNTLHLLGDGDYLILIVHDELPAYRIRVKASSLRDPAIIKLQLGRTGR